MEGRVYFSEHVSERIMSQLVNSAASAGEASITELSNRELQVFELIGHGYSTKDIAGQLHLSRKTVETYREKIKGNSTSPAEANWCSARSSGCSKKNR